MPLIFFRSVIYILCVSALCATSHCPLSKATSHARVAAGCQPSFNAKQQYLKENPTSKVYILRKGRSCHFCRGKIDGDRCCENLPMPGQNVDSTSKVRVLMFYIFPMLIQLRSVVALKLLISLLSTKGFIQFTGLGACGEWLHDQTWCCSAVVHAVPVTVALE